MRIQTVIKKATKTKDKFKRENGHLTYEIGIFKDYPRKTGNGLDILQYDGELAVLEIEDLLATDWEMVK